MHRTYTLIFRQSTTLQILTRNKQQLKISRRSPFTSLIDPKSLSLQNQKRKDLLPYYTINQQYLKAVHLRLAKQYQQLDVFRNKLAPNMALANGTQFEEYTLPKILQIGLRLINQESSDQVWGKFEKRVWELFRNTSVIDNCILLYLSASKMSEKLQSQVLGLLEQQAKLFTSLQKQFVFYTMCHLPQDIPLRPRINNFKTQLLSSVHKTKLNLQSLIQWIILSAIVNASPLHQVLGFYDKLFLYQKYVLVPQSLLALIKCIDDRYIIRETTIVQDKAKQIKSKLVQVFKKRASNYQQMLQAMASPKQLLLKSHLPSLFQTNLTVDQLSSSNLPFERRLYHLLNLFSNNKLQQYQLVSIYQSLHEQLLSVVPISNVSEIKQTDKNVVNYQNLYVLYYLCWVQLALCRYKYWQTIIDMAYSLQYIPYGLQWPLYNYIAYLTKTTPSISPTPSTQHKHKLQQILSKIKKSHNKYQKHNPHIKQLKQSTSITQMIKFIHQIKIWSFKCCQPINEMDYVMHFVNQNAKVVLHCLGNQDFVQGCCQGEEKEGRQGELGKEEIENQIKDQIKDNQEKQVNSLHILNKKMLKDNFGYVTIDIRVEQFMKMSYGDRLAFLRDKINESKIQQNIKKIQK